MKKLKIIMLMLFSTTLFISGIISSNKAAAFADPSCKTNMDKTCSWGLYENEDGTWIYYEWAGEKNEVTQL